MRRGLAVECDALDRLKIEGLAGRMRSLIKAPWSLNEEQFRSATTFMPRPPSRRDLKLRDEDLILRGSRQSAIGRALRTMKFGGERPSGRRSPVSSRGCLVDLSAPFGAVFLDVAPREVRANEPVQFTVAREGKIGVSYGGAEAGASTGEKRTFTVYPCLVRGSGAMSARALWDLRENQLSADGIGHEQVLVLTLPVVGAIEADLLVNARLIRPGLAGRLDAIRDMVLGPGLGSGPRARTPLRHSRSRSENEILRAAGHIEQLCRRDRTRIIALER